MTTIRLRLPMTPCRDCGGQALLADAWGRWTSASFLVLDSPAGARQLVCVHCSRGVEDPASLAPLTESAAGFLPGAAPALSEVELFDLLRDLGAAEVDETDALSRGDVGGGLW